VDIVDSWIEQEGYWNVLYVQMELCDGDLHNFLAQRYKTQPPEPLSELEIWKIFRQIMCGIQFIHSQGLVHRDIKPKNSKLDLICR